MHSKSVDSLSLTRAGFIEYFLVATKLVHALTAIAPALFLLYYPGLVPVELRSNMLGLLLFFGALTVIMFQALDVYSDDIFSSSPGPRRSACCCSCTRAWACFPTSAASW